MSAIVRDPPGRESREILKFRKNINFAKLILNLKNGELVCFRPRKREKNDRIMLHFEKMRRKK